MRYILTTCFVNVLIISHKQLHLAISYGLPHFSSSTSVNLYSVDIQQFCFVHPYHAWLTVVMSCCQHCLSNEMDEWRRGCRERERKSKNGDREGRQASPVRGLRASWKLSLGLGPSTVIELSWSFISFRLCDSRQKSDHHCSAWLAMAHTHKLHTQTTTGLRSSEIWLTQFLSFNFLVAIWN